MTTSAVELVIFRLVDYTFRHEHIRQK